MLASGLSFTQSWAARVVSAASASHGTPGQHGPTAAGTRVNAHRLAETLHDTQPHARSVPERPGVDSGTYAALKQRAGKKAGQGSHGPSSKPGHQGKPTAEFPTLTYTSTGQAFNPSDGGLAIGPTSELTAVNESWALYGRTGALLQGPVTFQSFFGISDTIFDPRALYDAGNASSGGYGGGQGRFVLAALTHNNVNQTASYTIAVSQNDNPSSTSSGWCTYRLNAVSMAGTSAT
jgi:hypothetical protein